MSTRSQCLLESVPIGFKTTLPSGKVLERREDGVYLDGQLMPHGPYAGCDTATDYRRRAAELTNKARLEKTRRSIVRAIEHLVQTKQVVSVAAVARVAKVSRQAIYKTHVDLLP